MGESGVIDRLGNRAREKVCSVEYTNFMYVCVYVCMYVFACVNCTADTMLRQVEHCENKP
jgi:type IV secretory pathway VirB3-like protein